MEEKVYQLKAEMLKALAHPTRLKIIEYLRDGEKCVCEFIEKLDIEQSNISQHLAILRKQDLVSCRKDGLKVIYQIKHPEVLKILDLTEELIECQVLDTLSVLRKLKGEGE